MMHLSSSLFLVLISAVSSLNITSPSSGTTLNSAVNNTITWTTRASDPSLIDLTIANQETTGETETLAVNVSTSLGKYTVPATLISDMGSKFVIIANSVPSEGNDFVAESGVFAVVDQAGASATSSGAAVPARSGYARSEVFGAVLVGVAGLIL